MKKLSRKYFYRYRSTDALLGDFAELENQSIYMAKPNELNDPMEGFRDVYWQGDEIIWKNFLRHYIICLYNRCLQYAIVGEEVAFNEDGISVFQNLDNLPTEQSRKLCERCIDKISSGPDFSGILKILSFGERRVSRQELCSMLTLPNLTWIGTIFELFRDEKILHSIKSKKSPKKFDHDFLEKYAQLMQTIEQTLPEDGWEIINDVQYFFTEQQHLLSSYNLALDDKPNYANLTIGFPEQYIKNLEKLTYPNWNVACFSKTASSAAMWSYYANGHDGCCLIFEPQKKNGEFSLPIKGINGYSSSGASKSVRNLPFRKVSYRAELHRLNFFQNMGRLPSGTVRKNWFESFDGAVSKYANYMEPENIDEWRKQYWEGFAPPLFQKLPDWKHEKEYRIISDDLIGLQREKSARVSEYDFENLAGIIFGIKLQRCNKLKIMRILSKKISKSNRKKPFEFYQAWRNRTSGKIDVQHMSLIEYK